MGKGRRTPPPRAAIQGVIANVRILPKAQADSLGGEGFLLLYDPSVATPARLDAVRGLSKLAACVASWVEGPVLQPLATIPYPWAWPDRAAGSRRIAGLVELCAAEAVAVIHPVFFDGFGADVRLQEGPLGTGEARAHQRLEKRKWTAVPPEPGTGSLTVTAGRIVVGSTLALDYTAEQKRREFEPGFEVEVPWPSGRYRVTAWTVEEESEAADGMCVRRIIARLFHDLSGSDAEPGAAPDRGHIAGPGR